MLQKKTHKYKANNKMKISSTYFFYLNTNVKRNE